MYYPCGENKGADQLRGYREADLRLCFRICKKPVFSRRGSFYLLFISKLSHCIFGFRDYTNKAAITEDADPHMKLNSFYHDEAQVNEMISDFLDRRVEQ